ncbi:sterol desaturase family protein [Aquimarina algiphila]|uniref:sterol desaturase family protein n=1 Tax=Aquimarina algiphila TaxID=2047982 RepID=UPI00232E730D|nr:sterol desaturase family protein [Aquimarina algiphila]
MAKELIHTIIYEYSYIWLYVLTFLYFFFLYFGIAPIFEKACLWLESKKVVHRILKKEATKRQKNVEKLHALKSIFVFGFSVLPVVYCIRTNTIVLLPDTFLNIILGVALLTIWNEIHFFVIHRIMHIPFFMNHVHKVHHKSIIPTVYSVYSFHLFEALLLSTVPITLLPFIPFSPVAVFLYPLASILLNYSGHCNYRFGTGKGTGWKLFGTRHNAHHSEFRKNYGFASNILDQLNHKISRLRQSKK